MSGAAIVAAARPVLIVLVPMFLVVPYAARLLLGRLRSVAAAVGVVALLLVALPLAGGSTLRTQFENTASLGGGSQAVNRARVSSVCAMRASAVNTAST